MSAGNGGKLLAAAVFAVVVGLVIYGLTRGPGQSAPTPEIDGPAIQPGPTEGVLGSVNSSVFQSFDPESGKLRYELEWETLDPVGQGRYELTAPVATFYTGDSVVEVRAIAGRLLWPSRDREPESGSLSGDVVVRVSEAGSTDAPGQVLGTLSTQELFFQSVLGELNAPEVVRIEAPGIEFEGRGLTARISEVQRRLQYLRVEEHRGTTVWPDRLGGSDEPKSDTDRVTRGGRRETSDEPTLIDLYRIAFSESVRIAQDARAIASDEAEVWVRLRDRTLAPGAIARLDIGIASDAKPSASDPDSSATPMQETADNETGPIRFENAGSIEIVPLAQEPSQLAADDLATRFRATSSPAVLLRDDESGAEMRCGSLTWGFTSRRLAVRGVGGALGVELDFPGEATVRTGAVDVDLDAGIAAFPGAGRVEILAGLTGEDERTAIEWTQRADVVLDTSSQASRLASRPLVRWLTATGEIEAQTGSATVKGDFLRADFSSRVSRGEAKNALNRVSVRDRASAVIRDGDVEADIRAGQLDVLFASVRDRDSARDRIVPTRASASGNAVATVNGDRLAGETIDAVLLAGEDRRTRVQSIDASGDVTLLTREGIDLAAHTMHASEETGTLTLVGYPATAGLYADASGEGASATGDFTEGFSITGESIRFDRGPRVLTVFGGGVLSYAAENAEFGGYDTGSVRWQRSMRFDDRVGSAEFVGGVTASATAMNGSEYSIEGERLALTLVSDLMDEQSRRSISESAQANDVVLAIRLEAGVEGRAIAEGRQYSAGPRAVDRSLETAARLTGDEIIVQRDTGRVLVPSAGRLVFEDRRPSDSDGDELPTDGRGTTVFDWSGSLDALQDEGRVLMSRDVKMRHRHLGTDVLTVVETERLTATLVEGDAESAEQQYVLDGVDAEGAVLATHGESQVVADRLTYSRLTERIIASALDGNRVTFFDAETGRHIPAERVILDLVTGRWRIEQAGQITTPLNAPGR
ncbi:MAG: hypothetical protein NXI14_00460 [bacterium]|nr:hypothetical protein [bacterium]